MSGCLRAKIAKLLHFDKFKMKKKKYVVLLLPFFIFLSLYHIIDTQGKLYYEYVK